MARHDDHWIEFRNDVFTPEEQAANEACANPLHAYAMCFCFKEAFMKALQKGWMNGGADWQDIQLVFSETADFRHFKTLIGGHALEGMQEIGSSNFTCFPQLEGEIASCRVILYR